MTAPSETGPSQTAPPETAPSVTVVVPTRDRPDLLRETLAAITAQEYAGPLDVLVVFDQSEPDPDIVSDGKRPIRATTNTRRPGLAGARNTGILAATGELVAFCDDDDVWLPGKLTAQVAALTAEPAAELVCCGVRIRYADTTVDRPLALRSVRMEHLLRSRLTELHPSTFLMRRAAVLDGFGLVDEEIPGSYAEDYELLLRAARRSPVLNLPEVLVEVRWHQRSYFSDRWDMISTALQWLLVRYPEFRGEPRGLARVTGQIAFANAAAGRRREAVRWAARTVRHRPTEARAVLALGVASGVVRADTVLRRLHAHGKGI